MSERLQIPVPEDRSAVMLAELEAREAAAIEERMVDPTNRNSITEHEGLQTRLGQMEEFDTMHDSAVDIHKDLNTENGLTKLQFDPEAGINMRAYSATEKDAPQLTPSEIIDKKQEAITNNDKTTQMDIYDPKRGTNTLGEAVADKKAVSLKSLAELRAKSQELGDIDSAKTVEQEIIKRFNASKLPIEEQGKILARLEAQYGKPAKPANAEKAPEAEATPADPTEAAPTESAPAGDSVAENSGEAETPAAAPVELNEAGYVQGVAEAFDQAQAEELAREQAKADAADEEPLAEDAQPTTDQNSSEIKLIENFDADNGGVTQSKQVYDTSFEQKDREWNGMEWNGMEWNGMEWNGMEWNGMEWSPKQSRFARVMGAFATGARMPLYDADGRLPSQLPALVDVDTGPRIINAEWPAAVEKKPLAVRKENSASLEQLAADGTLLNEEQPSNSEANPVATPVRAGSVDTQPLPHNGFGDRLDGKLTLDDLLAAVPDTSKEARRAAMERARKVSVQTTRNLGTWARKGYQGYQERRALSSAEKQADQANTGSAADIAAIAADQQRRADEEAKLVNA